MPEYSVWFVSALGIGTVFLGLVCIVILCSLVSFLCRKALGDGKNDAPASAPAAAPAPVAAPAPAAPIANRSKIVAAVSAVIAEELGTDVSAIRVKSFKKI